MTNVLWLVSWYPSRVERSNGDFIERHAIAVSKFVNLTVLFVTKDGSLRGTKVEVEKDITKGFTVYKVYYGKRANGLFEKLYSFKKYLQLQKKFYRTVVAEHGIPDIVHVSVAMKAGMLALVLKKKYKVPFVVTEHWAGYYSACLPNIYAKDILFKRLNKKILDQATLFLPVSNDLGRTVQQHFTDIPFVTIANTVDTGHFFFKPYVSTKFRFIHPSYLNYQKNPEGIIAACRILLDKGHDLEMLFIGRRDEQLMTFVKEHGMDKNVRFEAAIPYHEVAIEMQRSNALVLFSRFENLPCVILEALCCGLPIISTDVGGIPEVVDDSNGILVESGSVSQLVAAMEKMMAHYGNYNREEISQTAKAKFSFEKIGSDYHSIYKKLIVYNDRKTE